MITFELSSRTTVALLLGVALILGALHVVSVGVGPIHARRISQFGRLFDLNGEANVPAWYSSSLLLFCAVLLGVVAGVRRRQADRFALHWLAMSFVFALLSLDEAAALHEMTAVPLRTALHARGALYFTWVVPGAIFVVGFVLAYGRFLLALPQRTRRLFLAAGGLYVAATLGLEMLGGAIGTRAAGYRTVLVVEETAEMLALVLFVYALLDYARRHLPAVGFAVDAADRASVP